MFQGGTLIPEQGPGTKLKEVLKEWNFNPFHGCSCDAYIARMNIWGSDGCRENRETIIEWMMEGVVITGMDMFEHMAELCGVVLDRAILLAEGSE